MRFEKVMIVMYGEQKNYKPVTGKFNAQNGTNIFDGV